VKRHAAAREREAAELRRGIRVLLSHSMRRHRLALEGQPFDSWLLAHSRLFRRSRELYLASGGTFAPALLSTPRSLSSPALLEPRIEYSPVEAELLWAATDPLERKNGEHLLRVRTFTTSLFHEQNHRILWNRLPPAPREGAALRRYLNLAESLVIAADMALGDELGPARSRVLYLSGAAYDPGTRIRQEALSRRQLRNYLHAAMHATYLNLEGYDPAGIPRVIRALFPMLGELADRASERAGNLDALFIGRTNLAWQRKHRARVIAALARGSSAPLVLPPDPLDNREAYLLAEDWFESLGL
jgi:hypothetical protein